MSALILVDEKDRAIGQMDKLEVHQKGFLHRAFSIFIFNDFNQLLLQKRAADKYHSGGLWTNTCCGHPEVGENIEDACSRRLQEEMGFQTKLEFITSFIYKAELNHQLFEHEFDHVFFGRYNAAPDPNEYEVSKWRYVDLIELEKDIESNPSQYTVWFKIIFNDVKNHVLGSQKK
ncbi:MAG: isopentenyl-diphosphate Delta-isomerase [Bacteroidetes bacterium]|nr:isopentenyl-diphosphate Delta-isomerase [Bacteroidota bacterium]